MGKLSKPKPFLLPGRLVLQHRKSCKIAPGKCGLCHWANKKEAWKAALKEPSWLHVTLQGKVARVGCSACFLPDIGGPWSSFSQMPLAVKLHHLRRHEACKSHLAAVAARCGADHVTLAPDLQVFRDVLKNMRSGGSQRDGGPATDKKTQVRWCLSEAFLAVSRETLRTALSISMSRDERKGRILIRWRACTPSLSSASGVLGFLPVQGFADDLAGSFKAALQEFCTPRVFRPRGFVERQPAAMDGEVEKNVRANTGILTTDAAAPELLSSGLLSGRRPYAGSHACEDYLTSVKVIGRDGPHASTRFVKRGFTCSPDLQDLMNEFISGTDSFAQKVFHSPLYMGWWKELVKEDSGGPVSLAAAKHRFASFLFPLRAACRIIYLQ